MTNGSPSSGRYGGIIHALTKRFEQHLATIEAEYNFDYVHEFEIAICRVLRSALPDRCGICRGFVVASNGAIAGDDIIIYDASRFPTIRGLDKEAYDRKEKVPIEAVYAYIEAKHTLDIEGDGQSSLTGAISQVATVKGLCSQRQSVSLSSLSPYSGLGVGLSATAPPGWPSIRNPSYAMVLARRVRQKQGGAIITDPSEVYAALDRASFSIPDKAHAPDLVVAGSGNVVLPVIMEADRPPSLRSPFFIHTEEELALTRVRDTAFGVALCMLNLALDWIQLGRIPWIEIIGDEIGPSPT